MEEKTSTKKPFFSLRNIVRGIMILLSVFVFCPAALVSCSGEKIGTISAWQMISGFELGGELIDAYPFFALMLLIPVAVFVLSFIRKISKKTLGIITFAASLADILLWIVFFVMVKIGVEEFSCECKPTFWYVINLVFQAASTAAGLLVMIGVLDMDGFAPTKQQFVNSVNNGYFDYGGANGQNSYGFGGPQQAGGTAYSADPFAGASAPAAPAAPKIIGFCPRCGNPLRAGSAFCNVCGNPLPEEVRAISEQAEREAEEQARREAEERARREAEEQARREAEERARREAEEQARREEEERARREAEEQARREEEERARREAEEQARREAEERARREAEEQARREEEERARREAEEPAAQAMRAVREAQAARAAQAAQAAQAVQAAASTYDPLASRPMFCEACGAKLPPNAKFCERCGKKVM